MRHLLKLLLLTASLAGLPALAQDAPAPASSSAAGSTSAAAGSGAAATDAAASAPDSASASAPPRVVHRRSAASVSSQAAGSSADSVSQSAGSSEPAQAASASSPASGSSGSSGDAWDSSSGEDSDRRRHRRHHHEAQQEVSIGHDATLAAGEHAEQVVAILGNATSAGEVDEAVVAVLGDTHVEGPVHDSVVSVLGSSYVNSQVDQDVVAVLGDVTLGPQAQINGQLVVIGGSLTRDPQAVVHGGVERILGGLTGSLGWTHTWLQSCLAYGRPLAIAPGLDWAWGLALSFLVLYLLVGVLFPTGLERCVQTFELHPGESVLTALAALLLVPLVGTLLLITVIGIPALPFLLLALAAVILFGKAALFAWLGRRLTGLRGDSRSLPQTLLAILIGGVIALALYCVPVVGFVVFNLLGLLGLGVALYALLSASRGARRSPPPYARVPPGYGPPPAGPAPAGPTAAQAGAAAMGAAAQAGAAADAGVAAASEAASAAGAAADAGAAAAAAALRHGPAAYTPAELLALPRVSFWPRMGALLIDLVLVGVVLDMTLTYKPHNMELVVLAAYGAIMWKLKGMTIGGIIFGHQIARLDGQEVDWPTAIVRALGCILSAVCVMLGFIWIAIDEQRQAWHDKIAGTVVVQLPPGTARL